MTAQNVTKIEVENAGRAAAAFDIGIVFGLSITVFSVEKWARDNEILSLGKGSTGVFAVLAGGAAAIGLILARGGSFKDLGFRRPKRWLTVPLWIIGILAAYIGAQLLAPVVASMFIELKEPDMSRYAAYHGNLAAAISLVLILPFTASIPEEIIYRGFLMDRLTRIFGTDSTGAVLTVAVQALMFGFAHFQWGVGGIVVTTIMGLVWGTAFLLCGRNLWIVILTHSTGHVLMAVQLYLEPATG